MLLLRWRDACQHGRSCAFAVAPGPVVNLTVGGSKVHNSSGSTLHGRIDAGRNAVRRVADGIGREMGVPLCRRGVAVPEQLADYKKAVAANGPDTSE